MFRHTTKQRALEQATLRADALRTLANQEDERCDSYRELTYGLMMPITSKSLLTPVMNGLCNGCRGVDLTERRLHTVGMWTSDSCEVARLCFVQPEVVTCTANVGVHYYDTLNEALPDVQRLCNFAKPCGIIRHTGVCQVIGRMTPFLIDYCGLGLEVRWAHVNIMGSRFILSRTTASGTNYYSFTLDTLELIRPFAEPDGAFVKLSNNKSFKLTCSPVQSDTEAPNKNTCIIFQSDGSFRVQGLPSATGRVCRVFRLCIERVSKSAVWGMFLHSMERIDTE